jgi:prevent-host-death family protein
MQNLSIRETRAVLPELDAVLAREGSLIITRHGRPIARVVPLEPRRAVPSHADLRAAMPRLSTRSQDLLRAERDER